MTPRPVLLALLAALPAALGQQPPEPVWTAAPLSLAFNYRGSPSQPRLGPAGPYLFFLPDRFAAGEKMDDQLGCANNVLAPPFWYDNGRKMTGRREINTPAVGAVFVTPKRPGEKIRGFSFLGSFSKGKYAGVDGAVFYSDNHCYMGTLEYGFIRTFRHDTGYTQFYYMQYANCPEDGSMRCHVRDNAAPDTVARTCATGLNLPDLGGEPEWYRAFVFVDADRKHKFKVEVVDPKTDAHLWDCVVDPSAADPFQGCSGGYRQNTCGAGFPIASLYNAWGAVTATLNSTNVALPTGVVAMRIEEVRVGK